MDTDGSSRSASLVRLARRPLLIFLAILSGLVLPSQSVKAQIAFQREVSIAPLDFTKIAANSTTFVRVGKAGFVATSSDGRHWQNQDAGTYETFNKLLVVGERFVAAGDAGTIFTSENGRRWRARLAGTSGLNLGRDDDLLYTQTLGGFPRRLLRSADGVNWEESNFPPQFAQTSSHYARLENITLNGWDRTVNSGETELTAFNITQNPRLYPNANHPRHGALAFGNDTWISNAGYFSTDGQNWEAMSVIETFENRIFGTVTIAGERFFFVDNNPYSNNPVKLWTWKAGSEFVLTHEFEAPVEPDAAFANGVYLFLEHDSDAIYRSTDALTWSRMPEVLSSAALGYATTTEIRSRKVVAYDDGFLLLLGGVGFFSSPDGLNWKAVATNLSAHDSPLHLKYDGGLLVAHDGSRLWTAETPSTWTQVSGAPLTNIAQAVYSGSHLLVVGRDFRTSGLRHLAARDDGGHWTRAVLATDESLRDLVTGNGFTLAGFDDDIWSARDGVGPRITPAENPQLDLFQNQVFSIEASIDSTEPYTTQWALGSLDMQGVEAHPLTWQFADETEDDSVLVLKVSDGTHITSLVYSLVVHSDELPTLISPQLGSHAVPNEAGGLNRQLSIHATGSRLSYTWLRNGQPVSNNGPSLHVPLNIQTLGDTYQVVVANRMGSISSDMLTLEAPPLESSEIQLWGPSGPLHLTVWTTGAWGYQWRRNGIPIPGANSHSLSTIDAGPTHYEPIESGFYDVLIFNAETTIRRGPYRFEGSGDEPLPIDPPHLPWSRLKPAHLSNLSVRATAGSGTESLVPGFVLNGKGLDELDTPSQVLIRAVGPGLSNYGVTNPLHDPRLQLRDQDDTLIRQNFRWTNFEDDLTPIFESVGAFPLAPESADAALLHSIPAQTQSTILTVAAANTDGSTGEVLVELYLLPDGNGSHLTNLSTRGVVEPDRPLTAGFVIDGTGSLGLMMRAIGPGLEPFGIMEHAVSPRLTLFDEAGEIIAVSQATYPTRQEATETAVGAFPITSGSANAAIVRYLSPGAYTLQAQDELGGIVLVEIYLIPTNTPIVVNPSDN